ncbi:MAG: NAD-binding protein [Thiovulaceae bacterium]|nr:NAD-binding protein [Sulfurimonadaceae bacterium]
MLSRLLVKFALYLSKSPRYKSLKKFFRDLIENTHKPYKKYFDIFMIFVVISSILLLIQEVNHVLPDWLLFYNYEIVTIIFIVEYILRLWIYNDIHRMIIKEHEKSGFLSTKLKLFSLFGKIIAKKFEYIRSPAAIIDLLAILPSYRPLRVLRVFLLFRVIKLLRYTKSIQSFLGVIYSKKFELITLLVFLGFVVFISAVLIYVFEGNGVNENINDFFEAVYWAFVTISTVGYGDISPVTLEGRTVSLLVIIAGIGILSFATSIIVSAFTEKLDEMKAERTFQEAENLENFYLICGYSTMAQMVAKRLSKKNFDVVVIDNNKERSRQASLDGFVSIYGDATKLHTYHEMNVSKVERIIGALCLISDEVQNVFITLTLQSISPKIQIFARAQSRHLIKKLKLAGADHVVYAYESIGQMAKEYVGQPIAFDAINMMVAGQDETTIGEVTLYEHDTPVGKRLDEIDFFALRLILLGVKKKDDFIFNPQKDYVFQPYDTLIILGKEQHMGHLKEVVFSKKGRK